MLRRRNIEPTNNLRPYINKDFRGGLNTEDSPLNLAPKFQTSLLNMYPDTSGRAQVRFGTSLFAQTVAHIDEIVAGEYFFAFNVVVGANGKIVTVDAAGVVTLVWSTAIAALLPGAPAGWSTGLTFASFTQYSGALIICNGIDKPLSMDTSGVVTYLQDAGTGSNVNTPRAKYCATHNQYLVLAVTPTDTSTLYIGMRNVRGTFVGDPGVDNDAVNFNTSVFIKQGQTEITGLRGFRDRLIVSYAENLLPVKLGDYEVIATVNTHVPRADDPIEAYGAVSHQCMVPLGDDIAFLDKVGISSVKRATLNNTLTPLRDSVLVSADIQLALSVFTPAQLSDYTFGVLDRGAQQVMFFIPKTTPVTSATDNYVYVLCFDAAQKFRAITLYDNMPFRCGWRTTEGRIFLCTGTDVYLYHSKSDPLYQDLAIPGEQAWDDGTFWDDDDGWVELSDDPSGYIGDPIEFDFTLPWSELGSPERNKISKYLLLLLEGAGNITVEMYTDRGTVPELTQTFTVTNTPTAPGATVRPTNHEQLYAWNSKFQRQRLRITGNASSYISIVAVGLMASLGSLRR